MSGKSSWVCCGEQSSVASHWQAQSKATAQINSTMDTRGCFMHRENALAESTSENALHLSVSLCVSTYVCSYVRVYVGVCWYWYVYVCLHV